MKRREFITLLGGVATWPIAARGQTERIRRIGWLEAEAEGDEISRAYSAALFQALAELGWDEGRNLRIERRFGYGNPTKIRSSAAELAALAPDVIITTLAAATRAMQLATQTIPIVFTSGGDAAALGLIKNIARPEGNTTGFASSEPATGGKWLELLMQAAPHLTRVAVVFSPVAQGAPDFIEAIEPAARTLRIQTMNVVFHDGVELVRALDSFASTPNSGLLMLPPARIPEHGMIIKLAAEHRLPAIYSQRYLAAEGGLISYGADATDQFRRAAGYVDRILRGAKVSDLPVQFPTKYQLVVNMKTAKAIGLDIPAAMLARADEVIE
jgi:putative ABC transport system substrate-binding protein